MLQSVIPYTSCRQTDGLLCNRCSTIELTEVTLILLHTPAQVCWICGKSVDLTASKTDEHGAAVHEQCYAAKVALKAGSHISTNTALKDTA